MSDDPRSRGKGDPRALSAFLAVCQACFFAGLLSCSSSFGAQEKIVKDLFEAARHHDVSTAAKLMPRMSLLSSDQQKLALDNLSRIGTYRIAGSKWEGEAVIVTLEYSQGGDAMSLSIPVRKQDGSWIIGDDFRVRRTLEGQSFERTN
jgi:hypothetical protein